MSGLQRLAVLVTVLVTTLFATTSMAAPTSQAETRVWEFLFASGECVGDCAPEVSGTHQGNDDCRYDFASGDTVAARGTTTAYRAFTQGNFRTNLARLTGANPATSQAHQTTPKRPQPGQVVSSWQSSG